MIVIIWESTFSTCLHRLETLQTKALEAVVGACCEITSLTLQLKERISICMKLLKM